MRELRKPAAVLNELSLPDAAAPWTEDHAVTMLSGFASTMRALRACRRDVVLMAPMPLLATPVTATMATLGQVASARGGRSRDELQSVRLALNKAPLPVLDLAEEHTVSGVEATGLGIALVTGMMGVSFSADPWDRSELEITRSWLEDDDAGQTTQRREVCRVPHASSPGHVDANRERILDLALPAQFTGAHLWEDRELLYPSLELLPGVEQNLLALTNAGDALRHVHLRLRDLDSACREW